MQKKILFGAQLTLVVALLGGGCVQYHPRPIDTVKTAAVWQSRSLDSEALHAFMQKHLAQPPARWPLQNWDIGEITVAAFFYNPGLEVARAQWQGSRGAEITAAQRPNPTLTLSPGYDFTATSLGANPWLPGTTIDLPIETMGKRGLRTAQAKFATESSRLALVQTAWTIRSNVRSNLLNLVSWTQKCELLKQQLEVQKKIGKSFHARVEAGAASSTEQTLMEVAFRKLQVDFADATQQKQDALYNLAESIGVPAAAMEKIEYRITDHDMPEHVEKLNLAELRDIGLKNRTDILSALADYSAGEVALQLQIAKQYPDIHFSPNYQYNQGDHQFLVGLSAELPLLNQNQGPIAEAKAKRKELAARFYQVQSHAIADIEHAFASFQNSIANQTNLQALAYAQERQASSVESQKEAGAADELDELNSKSDLLGGKLVLLDAQMKAFQSFGVLEDAIQRPIELVKPELIEYSTHPVGKERKP